MNWILIANTTTVRVDYTLAVIMFVLGWAVYGLVKIIRGSRKKETKANEEI